MVNAKNDSQQTNLAEPVDCDNSGLMQLPKSIKLQTSGAALSRRTSRRLFLDMISLIEIYIQKNIYIRY